MGRPKGSTNKAPNGEVDEVEGQDAPAQEEAVEVPEPKLCPRCGAEVKPYKDMHGYWRCGCQACGYWDSEVRHTEAEAVANWNASGGPSEPPL